MRKKLQDDPSARLDYERAWRVYKRFRKGVVTRAELADAIAVLRHCCRSSELDASSRGVAALLLGVIYQDKNTPAYSLPSAKRYLKTSAGLSVWEAAWMLAELYRESRSRAALTGRYDWLVYGYHLGSSRCTFHMGLSLLAGNGVTRDLELGMHAISEAASRGEPDAQAVQALVQLWTGDARETQKYRRILQQLTTKNCGEASLIHGSLLLLGRGSNAKSDAMQSFRTGAKQKNPAAMWNLSACSRFGIKLAGRRVPALYWSNRAASEGDALAQRFVYFKSPKDEAAKGPLAHAIFLTSYSEILTLLKTIDKPLHGSLGQMEIVAASTFAPEAQGIVLCAKTYLPPK